MKLIALRIIDGIRNFDYDYDKIIYIKKENKDIIMTNIKNKYRELNKKYPNDGDSLWEEFIEYINKFNEVKVIDYKDIHFKYKGDI